MEENDESTVEKFIKIQIKQPMQGKNNFPFCLCPVLCPGHKEAIN